jgi:hypothetical protein
VSSTPTGVLELSAAVDALDRVAVLTAEGRPMFDSSRDRQLALAFLWVNIGSLLKQYCRKLDIELGTEPFSGPIKMRDKIAYGPVAALSADIVWDTCVRDGPTLRNLVADLRSAL